MSNGRIPRQARSTLSKSWLFAFSAIAVLLLVWNYSPTATTQGRKEKERPDEKPRNAGYRSQGNKHKVKVSDETAAREVESRGGRLIADYSSFKVFEVDNAAVKGLGEKHGVEVRDEDNLILLNAGAIDTTLPVAQAGRRAAGAFGGKRMHLVQFAGPVKPEWYESLVATGVRVVSYIPNNAYLVFGNQNSLQRLEEWARESGVVQWDSSYENDFKVHPGVDAHSAEGRVAASPEPEPDSEEAAAADFNQNKDKAGAASAAEGAARAEEPAGNLYGVQLLDDAGENPGTVELIQKLQTEPTLSEWEVLVYRNFVVRLPSAEAVAELAKRPDVVFIEPYVVPQKRDERQNQIVAGNLIGNAPVPGDWLAYLASKGFTQGQFTASGFVVDVGDDGLDNATTSPNHPSLYVFGDKSNASRVAYARKEGLASGSEIRGCEGHGTLNSHIVGGYVPHPFGSGFPHADSAGFRYGMGVAPFVKVGSSVIFSPGFTNPNIPNWQSRAYNNGARISTNSWGAATSGGYNLNAQTFDAMVRDAQPATAAIPAAGNQEMVLIFASGNDGPGAQTVGAPGTAKNVITVGAAENVHSHSTANGGTAGGTDGCGTGDTGADSAHDIIGFSSRGPTSDGRKKPEVVAPGTHVTGGVFQASGALPANGQADPCFTAVSVCSLGSGGANRFFPLGQQWYTTSSGTSHSTPAVAGAAALIRQHFINQSLTPPSPAMTKALLMNSARYMTGDGANDALWSNSQGMGSVDLNNYFGIFDTPSILKDQRAADTFTASGQVRVIGGTINDSTKPFRVTLAWTDVPGPTSGNTFVNNLDMEVTVGGHTYKGNVFSGAFSATGGSADFRNNAESVLIPAGVSGPFLVTVKATNVAADGVPNSGGPIDQDFALVVFNGTEEPTAVIGTDGTAVVAESCSPTNGAVDSGESVSVNFALKNVGTGNTSNLVATLLPTGGVTSPGGPQSYGALTSGGASVSRAFNFVVDASCGGTVVATLQLQDGAKNLGTVSFPLTVGATIANSFGPITNTTAMTIPAVGTSVPYPTAVNVSGAFGTVTNVTVSLHGVNHTFPDDMDVLLVGPGGQKVLLMSDAGGGGDLVNATLTFDDQATQSLPDATNITPGTYRPTNFGAGDVFGAPAPGAPYDSTLAAFDGLNPNGTWSLYVVDQFSPDGGSIVGGWSLNISTTDPACCGVALMPKIVAAPPAVLTAESCSVANNVVDAQETVTVEFPVQNIGVGAPSNLVATLLPTGGVTAPSAPESYGSPAPGGGAVSRPFTFTVDATCGEQVTATLQLHDGLTDLGTVTYTIPTGTITPGTVTATYGSSDVAVAVPDLTTVEIPIEVTDLGEVADINVRVRLNHAFVGDLDMFLVAPDGSAVELSTDNGTGGDNYGSGTNDCSGTFTVFDDSAATLITAGVPPYAGAFRPEQPLAALNGKSTKGTWKLRVTDDEAPDPGLVGCVQLEFSRRQFFCCGVDGTPDIKPVPPATLVSECNTNAAPDPGEVVTMSFPLRNVGTDLTGDLVATLQPTGGVTPVSGPQSYGALSPIGPAASRDFTFAVDGSAACGSDITATFRLQDGAEDLGTVSFTIKLGVTQSATQTFSHATSVAIPGVGTGTLNGAPAAPYPASITVSGVVGPVSKVSVKLKNLNHSFPGDVDMLLVGPGGQRLVILSDVLGTSDWVNTTYTLEDSAAAVVPAAGVAASGAFRPTNHTTGDIFPVPAPAGPHPNAAPAGAATFASVFNGTDPNGTWRLYAVDDALGDAGNMAGGWELNITTQVPVCETVAPVNITDATVSRTSLWPPNHLMQDVAVNYGTGTACSTCSLSVSSNEPVNGNGDGDTSPDWEVLSDHAVRLRAERSGGGGGRVYTITITCLNGHGTDTETVKVTVPHSNNKKSAAAGPGFRLDAPFDLHGTLWGQPATRWGFDGPSTTTSRALTPRPQRSGRRASST